MSYPFIDVFGWLSGNALAANGTAIGNPPDANACCKQKISKNSIIINVLTTIVCSAFNQMYIYTVQLQGSTVKAFD